ncbi:MAG: hypothetical protein AAFY88_10255 [Acidobacteriota bacterium]
MSKAIQPHPRRFLPVAFTMALFAALPMSATADDREVQVNLDTAGSTFNPVIEALDGGGFVVAWSRAGQPITGRLLDALGQPAGAEFAIGLSTSGVRRAPSLEKLSDGRLVAVWAEGTPTFRFLSAEGLPVGGQFGADDVGTTDLPTVASAPDGGFLVAWDCLECAGDGWSVYSQRFDAAGHSVAGPIQLDGLAPGSRFGPSAISRDNSGFLVVWNTIRGTEGALSLRRLDVDGQPLGAEIELDAAVDLGIRFAAAGAGDRFVTAVSSFSGDERLITLYRFDAFGNRIGAPFTASVDPPYGLSVERVSMDAAGQIDLLGRRITDPDPTNFDRDVVALRFDFDEGLKAANFQVNSRHRDDQYFADAVRTPDRFLVVWSSRGSFGDDDEGYSVQVRSSFGTLFADGFESGDGGQWNFLVGGRTP